MLEYIPLSVCCFTVGCPSGSSSPITVPHLGRGCVSLNALGQPERRTAMHCAHGHKPRSIPKENQTYRACACTCIQPLPAPCRRPPYQRQCKKKGRTAIIRLAELQQKPDKALCRVPYLYLALPHLLAATGGQARNGERRRGGSASKRPASGNSSLPSGRGSPRNCTSSPQDWDRLLPVLPPGAQPTCLTFAMLVRYRSDLPTAYYTYYLGR